MSETEETESTGEAGRPIDIEDQGQETDAGEESNPGPVGVGVREATQKAGEAPTEILDDTPSDT